MNIFHSNWMWQNLSIVLLSFLVVALLKWRQRSRKQKCLSLMAALYMGAPCCLLHISVVVTWLSFLAPDIIRIPRNAFTSITVVLSIVAVNFKLCCKPFYAGVGVDHHCNEHSVINKQRKAVGRCGGVLGGSCGSLAVCHICSQPSCCVVSEEDLVSMYGRFLL